MIILASASKRRVALLEQMGLDFTVIESEIDENVPDWMPPWEVVGMLSKMKAENVCGRINEDAVVIAADTIVYADGLILGKPEDESEAFSTLRRLSGRKHTVYTGLTVLRKSGCDTLSETVIDQADVYMRVLTDNEIWDYIYTGEPMDKAGAYGIQGKGAVFVERIDGDFYTVVGLPLVKLYKIVGFKL